MLSCFVVRMFGDIRWSDFGRIGFDCVFFLGGSGRRSIDIDGHSLNIYILPNYME